MEVELQYVYLGGSRPVIPTQLADLELRRSRSIALLDTYYDTESLALRRAGCSLRVRLSDRSLRPLLTFKGPSRRRSGAKRRHEAEIELAVLPSSDSELVEALMAVGLEEQLRSIGGIERVEELRAVGELRNRRSRHRYDHGLHSLQLTWDQLEFPTGKPQTRLEVEAGSPVAERLLGQADRELRELFGDDLAQPERGKTRELCERLYPELLAT